MPEPKGLSDKAFRHHCSNIQEHASDEQLFQVILRLEEEESGDERRGSP